MPLRLLGEERCIVMNRTEPAKMVNSEAAGSGLRCIDFDRELCKGANHHPNLGYPHVRNASESELEKRAKH